MKYYLLAVSIAGLFFACKIENSSPTTSPPEPASLTVFLTLQDPGDISLRKHAALTGDSIYATITDDGKVIKRTAIKVEDGTSLQLSEVPSLKDLKIYAWIEDSVGRFTHALKDSIKVFLQPGSDSTITDVLHSLRSGLRGVIAPPYNRHQVYRHNPEWRHGHRYRCHSGNGYPGLPVRSAEGIKGRERQ